MRERQHRVLKLWVRPVPKGEMVERESLALEAGLGVAGDSCYGKRRHVTIVFLDDWNEAARALGREVDPAGRRANVLVSGGGGLRYCGRRVRLGGSVIEIHGETRPCQRMDDAAPGLMEALRPGGRAGVWGSVVEGGTIRPGDPLMVIEEARSGAS
jgi:MOSC domain-containing protein YiiM